MRLTKAVRKQLLLQNERFSTRTSYDSRNSEYERIYTIEGGRLHIREIGKHLGQTADMIKNGMPMMKKYTASYTIICGD